jgi:tetratricopeptide (TPR) repeat protein
MDNTRIPFEAYRGTDPYIFVSYAHKDSDQVFPIIAEFHQAGFPVWYDEGIDPGNEWPEEIAKALLNCSLFIVFISASAAESRNVVREINYALSKNKPFIHIWLEDATLNPGLEMQISSNQGIMRFRMERENFDRKCQQSFEAFGIKKAKAQTVVEKPQPVTTQTVADNKVYAQAEAAVPAEGGSAEFFDRRAMSYAKNIQYDKAIADLNEAIRMDPFNINYFYHRANCYDGKHDYDKAIADLNEVMRMGPHNTERKAQYLSFRGRCYLEKGEYDKANTDINEAVDLKPSNGFLLKNLAELYRKQGNYDKAIANYNKLIRLNPSYAEYFAERGSTYYDKGDYKNAVADLKEAGRLIPNRQYRYKYKEKLKEAQSKAGGFLSGFFK